MGDIPTLRAQLMINAQQHRQLADRWLPHLFGLFGDAYRYQFHLSAFWVNKTMIGRLDHVNCDDSCIERVRRIHEQYDACITGLMQKNVYTKLCKFDDMWLSSASSMPPVSRD
jgi:hypothetical protein